MMVEKNDPDLAFNGFYRKMMELVENNVPRKKITKNNREEDVNLGLQKKSRKACLKETDNSKIL